MKRFFFMLGIVCLSNAIALGQDGSKSRWEDENSSPWVGNEQAQKSGGTSTTTITDPPKDVGGSSPSATPVPIDGGLGILLVGGALYGAKRIRSQAKKSVE